MAEFNVCDWTWEVFWEDAEMLLALFERCQVSRELTEQERGDAAAQVPFLRALVVHKKTLNELPDADM